MKKFRKNKSLFFAFNHAMIIYFGLLKPEKLFQNNRNRIYGIAVKSTNHLIFDWWSHYLISNYYDLFVFLYQTIQELYMNF